MKKYNFTNPNGVGATTYAGEAADEFFSAALDGSATIEKGYVDLMEGITHKLVLNTVTSNDDIIQASASGCAFTDGDSITIGEQVMTLTDLAVMEQVCIKDIVPLWHSYVRKASRHGMEEPAFLEYLQGYIAAKVGEQIEKNLWQGASPFGTGLQSNSGTNNESGADASIFTGFTEETIPALTNSNIDDKLADVFDAVNQNVPGVLDQAGAGFYVSRKTYYLYAQYLANSGSGQGVNMLGSNQGFDGLTYLGFPLYMCPGAFDDTIVFTYPSNIKVGTSAGADFNTLKVIDLRETTGEDLIRMVGRFQLGAQVANSADGVFARAWTA